MPNSVNHIYGRNRFGSTYLKKEGKKYKEQMIKIIQREVKEQKWNKCENTFIYLDETVYMNRKGRDADNLKKLTQDCITESDVVWTDDSYCLPRTQRVFIDNKNPRIELILSKSESIGIFDSKQEYKMFVNTYCNNCTRGEKIGQKGGCSIYRDALDNRIKEEIPMNTKEEINNKKCLKFKQNKK